VAPQATGKSVKPANFAAAAHHSARDGETKLLDRMEKDFDATLKDHLAAVNKDLGADRQRLGHYEA
jgi:hypothetical protein